MREKLIQYVDLLFAGMRGCEDIRQEILQNTLDRYDDLIAEGKVPEAAYRLAISGIGDISEIMESAAPPAESVLKEPASEPDNRDKKWMRAVAVGMYILCPIPLFVLSELGMDTIGLCGTLAIVAAATILIILAGKKPGRTETDEPEEKEKTSPLAKSISGLIWAIGLAVYLLVSFATGAWHITWVIFPVLGAVDHIQETLISSRKDAGMISEPEQNRPLRKAVSGGIWAAGLAVYFLLSFGTQAWYITWVMFPIIGAVQGLVNAVWDLKEAIQYEN